MKKILSIFGTRPEAIKMCPVIKELQKRKNIHSVVCVTGQHQALLHEVLKLFSVRPDYDLSIMKQGQTLFDITGRILQALETILREEHPDLVLVHGDTTTAFAAGLACFYLGIPLGHVEAGLRTYDLAKPFPEEFNRRTLALLAQLHFAPTEQARENLLSEGVPETHILVTGNTAIDALRDTVKADYTHPLLDWTGDSRLLLLTTHRRESIGDIMQSMLLGIRRAIEGFSDCKLIFPMHPNPAVRRVAQAVLGGSDRIRLIDPLSPYDFHNLLARCYLVLTDSGGVQEEAPALDKPVLVLRESTERTEGIKAGTLQLAGTSAVSVYKTLSRLLSSPEQYTRMAAARNPYGDGYAAKRIADLLEKA